MLFVYRCGLVEMVFVLLSIVALAVMVVMVVMAVMVSGAVIRHTLEVQEWGWTILSTISSSRRPGRYSQNLDQKPCQLHPGGRVSHIITNVVGKLACLEDGTCNFLCHEILFLLR